MQASIVLPDRPFLYTVDQIATLISVEEVTVRNAYLHYEGRSTGACPRDKMVARNISPAGLPPEWRVDDRSLRRWMKFKGYRYYERGHYS